MRSFRTRLTILFWLFAIIPVIWLSFNQLQNNERQVIELSKKQLVFDFNEKLSLLRQTLENSFSQLDKIASDGSIITSSTMDLMSVKVIKTLQGFLDNNRNFSNIMILDRNLFQIEARPNQALTLDLSPFTSQIDKIFNDKNTINDPNVRIIIIPKKANSQEFLFAAARPILRPKESLITPFEVTGVLFTTIALNDFVSNLLKNIGSDGQGHIAIFHDNRLIYQNAPLKPSRNNISHEANFTIGKNASFTIRVTSDLTPKLSFIALITKEKNTLIITLGLLWLILISANNIIKRLIQPIDDLKQLTRNITETNWHSDNPVIIDTSAHYKEFHELKLLLQSMSETIQRQFSELNDSNSQLTALTKALQASVKQSEQHNETLQNLLDYDLFIRKQENIEVISCLTLELAFNLLNKAIGLVIYRSKFQPGFKSLERANHEFLNYIQQQHMGKVYFDLAEIEQINQVNQHFQLTVLNRENKCLGYIVTPPIDQASFQARSIEIFVASLQSRLQELQLKDELSKLANTDALTGLYNRHYFEKTFSQYKSEYFDQQHHFALMLIDIDGLKLVNDQFGHNAGDLLIIKVAEFLQHHLRASDVIARTGGDEFIILLSEVDSNYCQPLSLKLMKKINKEKIMSHDKEIPLSFSCGYASTHEDPIDNLIEIADKRMYQNKTLST